METLTHQQESLEGGFEALQNDLDQEAEALMAGLQGRRLEKDPSAVKTVQALIQGLVLLTTLGAGGCLAPEYRSSDSIHMGDKDIVRNVITGVDNYAHQLSLQSGTDYSVSTQTITGNATLSFDPFGKPKLVYQESLSGVEPPQKNK